MTDDSVNKGFLQAVRTRVSDNGRIVRFWHVVNGKEEKLFDLDVGGVDSLIVDLLEKRPKMGEASFRATHHQLFALAAFLKSRSSGHPDSPEGQFAEIATNAAVQIQAFTRLKDLIKQDESVRLQISRIVDGPK